MNDQLLETVIFIVHSIKQFCYGFERLDEISDEYEPGSAPISFYMSAIYQHIAVFYLLDKNPQDTMGGTFYKALKRIGFESLLDPIQQILQTPIGSTTFGEIVRVFRNKAIVHSSYRDTDLSSIYKAADMEDPEIAKKFHESLHSIYYLTRFLGPDLVERAGFKLEDFGIIPKFTQ